LRLLLSGHTRTAYEIFTEIEFQTSIAAALSYVMLGIRRFLLYMTLFLTLILYPYFYLVFITSRSVPGFLRTSSGNLSVSAEVLVATLCGMLGSVVSVLLRLGEFETTRGRSRMFLTLTGATLPVVGGVFGAFVAALLLSKVVNIAVGDSGGSNVWLYVVIGFLSGFSERFSRGFLRIAENQFVGGADRDTQQRGATTTVVTSTSPESSASSAKSLTPATPPSS
jgi:hypothetical protein